MGNARVLLTDYAWEHLDLEREILAAAGAELVVAPSPDLETLQVLARDVSAIMTCWAQVPDALLAHAPACRIVARLGIGLDNIDVEACSRRGIVVTNVPDYCVAEVAEHTLGLLFALARQLGHFLIQTAGGTYNLRAAPTPLRLEGRVLGLIGCGRIGRRVAQKALALGLVVQVYNRSRVTGIPGLSQTNLDTLLRSSDFVSLHLPLSDETHHLLSAGALQKMRSSAFLINTSRGGLVDHAALAECLARDGLAGAALDVQEPEPPPLDQPPFSDRRVFVTPHAAFVSEQSVTELRRRAATQVAVRLRQGAPEHVVNPEVLQRAAGPAPHVRFNHYEQTFDFDRSDVLT